MRVLAVGAHPDDIEFGAGGTLAKHHENGDVIELLVLTSGETGRGHHSVEVREREACEAALLLDAEISIARLADAHVSDGKPTIDVVEAATAAFRPDVAYIHSVNDTHQDHRAAALASRVALRSVTKLYAFQGPSASTAFTPQRYPDITNFMQAKLRLIEAHKSQCDVRPYMAADFIEATARYWGLRAGCRYTEPMEVIHDRDPLPEAF